MKKNFYFAPSIEEEMVLVESGIAASTVDKEGNFGSDWIEGDGPGGLN